MLFPGTARDLLSRSGKCEGRTLAPYVLCAATHAGVEPTIREPREVALVLGALSGVDSIPEPSPALASGASVDTPRRAVRINSASGMPSMLDKVFKDKL